MIASRVSFGVASFVFRHIVAASVQEDDRNIFLPQSSQSSWGADSGTSRFLEATSRDGNRALVQQASVIVSRSNAGI
jgi:hypothetical protein